MGGELNDGISEVLSRPGAQSEYDEGARRNLELSSPHLNESRLAAVEEVSREKSPPIDMHAQTQKVQVDVIPEEADASNDDLRVALVK